MVFSPSRLALATALIVGTGANPAFANDADAENDSAAAQDGQGQTNASGQERVEDDLHSRQIDYQGNIIVSAVGLAQLDLLAGTDVYEAEEIQENLNGQIGEVLVKIPGVSASSFAPGASRPVLRGQQGERVRVLIDGLGTLDVSNTSADHGVTVDPLTAERIEVLRGPAVLLFGSQAIGGAINVIDKRIPLRVPDEGVHVDALIAGNTAFDLRQGGASVDVPVSDNFVFHVDGSFLETNDFEIGGLQLSPELQAEVLELAAEEAEEGELEEAAELLETAEQEGVVPNSASRIWTANGGFAYIDGQNSFGVSVGYYDSRYGIPGRPGGEHAEEEGEEGEEEEGEEEVFIDLEQFRADLRGTVDLGDGFFSLAKLRVGYSDYTHTEFEGPGEVGTVFDVEGIEARLELTQKDTPTWRGSVGAQYFYRDFVSVGAEAFVPPNTTEQFSLFTLQEFGNGPFQVEAGGRLEFNDVEDVVADLQRDFTSFSGAVGLIYEGDEALRLGVNLSRVERAPSAEELFSNGPHIATQAFEIGDPDLDSESAFGIEAFARGRVGRAEFNVTVFQNWFDDYIFLEETGEEEDGLPVFVYLQDDAQFFGVEGELTFPLYDTGNFSLITDLRGEYVSAELDDDSALPRIPPLSLLAALEAQTSAFDVRAEVHWFAEQDSVTTFETPTDDFALVNAAVSWRPLPSNENVTVLVQLDNIFDVVGRRHASFTKDFVPLPGRNFKGSVRVCF